MDEPDWENCREEEFWAYVAWHLNEAGIESVLVGGAAVAIYTDGEHKSPDIDLVLLDERARNRVEEVMVSFGFERSEDRKFRHPQCAHLAVEFPVGPLALGNDTSIDLATKPVAGRLLKLLGPTDCVKDRLTAFVHWGARDCFKQAVLVCIWQDSVDLRELQHWCAREGAPAAFRELREAIQKAE